MFLHGIGIGHLPYVPLLAALKQRGDSEDGSDVGIITIEILPVSARITRPVLSKEEFCRQLEIIMIHHGFEKFVLLAGSWVCVQKPRSRRDTDTVATPPKALGLFSLPNL